MHLTQSRIWTFASVFLFVAFAGVMASAQNACQASDAKVLLSTAECGNRTFTLKANVTTRGVLTYGNVISYGVCNGAFTNCQDEYVQPMVVNGHTPSFESTSGATSVQYRWFAISQFAVSWDEDCECEDPNPAGVVETLIDNQTYTPMLYENCDGD